MNRNRRFVKPTNTVFGVEAVAHDIGSDCMIVAGTVIGNIKEGDELTIANPSDDNCPMSLVEIVKIGNFKNSDEWNVNINWSLKSAENMPVILMIRLVTSEFPIKIGSVIYAKQIAAADICNVYKTAIEGGLVRHYNLDIPETDLKKMSVMDCTEAIDKFSNIIIKNAQSNEEIDEAAEKINKLKAELVKKLLEAKRIYVLYNGKTLEPHMDASLVENENKSFTVKAPRIRVFSEAAMKLYGFTATGSCSLNRIEHDDIQNVFSNAIYRNGAGALLINGGMTLVAGNLVVPVPEGFNSKTQKLRMWMLLRDQLDPSTKNYHIYNALVEQSMTKAQG